METDDCGRSYTDRLSQFAFRFFKSIDWDDVVSKQLKPPIIPKFDFDGDTRNFEEYAESDWINVPEASAKEERMFRDF